MGRIGKPFKKRTHGYKRAMKKVDENANQDPTGKEDLHISRSMREFMDSVKSLGKPKSKQKAAPQQAKKSEKLIKSKERRNTSTSLETAKKRNTDVPLPKFIVHDDETSMCFSDHLN